MLSLLAPHHSVGPAWACHVLQVVQGKRAVCQPAFTLQDAGNQVLELQQSKDPKAKARLEVRPDVVPPQLQRHDASCQWSAVFDARLGCKMCAHDHYLRLLLLA